MRPPSPRVTQRSLIVPGAVATPTEAAIRTTHHRKSGRTHGNPAEDLGLAIENDLVIFDVSFAMHKAGFPARILGGRATRYRRPYAHQIVLTPLYARSFSSPVTSGTPSVDAVATMSRSAGSPCIGSAKPPATTAMSAEIDSTLISGRLFMSASH